MEVSAAYHPDRVDWKSFVFGMYQLLKLDNFEFIDEVQILLSRMDVKKVRWHPTNPRFPLLHMMYIHFRLLYYS